MFGKKQQNHINKRGGVHVAHNKFTAESESVRMPIPAQVVIPLRQHIGAPCTARVKVGDLVKVGQLIGDSEGFVSAPIHASVSGKVTKIGEMVMPQGLSCETVTIESDGQMEPYEGVTPPKIENRQDFLKAIRSSGLVGLGGAGFPTHVKLNPKDLDKIDYLIVNGAECEPYITSDYREMMENSRYVYNGILTAMKYLEVDKAIFGIEDNKPKAIELFTQMFQDHPGVQVMALPAYYPQGAEKVLIYKTTGRVVKEGQLPMDAGVVVMNVTSVSVMHHYIQTGMPLVEKRITVDGSAVKEPKNVIVPIGTRIGDVIEFCGGYKTPPRKLLMGGPMMGTALCDDNFPVIKNNNAILALDSEVVQTQERACMRCGRCVRACPMNLMPLNIDKYYHARNVEDLKRYSPQLCMECGCCSYVCPSKRNLTQTIKLAKGLVSQK